jgi:uncharacterized protein
MRAPHFWAERRMANTMKKIKLPKYTRHQLILYMIGVMIMPLGVVFTINAHLGAGGYDALNFALGEKLGIYTSYAIYGTAFLAIFITAAIRKGFPRFTTFISSFFIGLATDFWKKIFVNVQGTTLISSIIIMIMGLLLIGIAVASYMRSGLPTNPTDDLIVACKERGFSIRISKIIMDAICVIIAFLLGGEIGIGTIVVTFLLGPIIDFFYGLIPT